MFNGFGLGHLSNLGALASPPNMRMPSKLRILGWLLLKEWFKEGDANTKLLQAFANGRRAKNFIPHIKIEEEVVTDQVLIEEAFSSAYEELLGFDQARDISLDLDFLGVQAIDLHELEEIFTEGEVWQVIKELHPDRAPGPDGFSGAFYQRAWPIIKHDIMAAIMKLYVCDGRGFPKLNRALIVLIPKKSDAEEIGDYRPISLPHSFTTRENLTSSAGF
jgi:hypothetical protein